MRLVLDDLEKSVGELEIVVDGAAQQVNVKSLCAINMENLVEEFTKHPSNYAWYATILSLYEVKRNEKINDLEAKYAELDIEVRRNLSPEELKTIKEKNIESRILINDKYKVMQDEVLDYERIVKRLQALVKGLETKRDMLIQVGARARKEMDLDNFGR